LTIWVRRRRVGSPTEMWHLFETMTQGGLPRSVCGEPLGDTDTLDRLELANPIDADRCGRCQTVYLRELSGEDRDPDHR
jgi:hypothetical protein